MSSSVIPPTHTIRAAHWEGSEDGRIFAPDFGDVYATTAGAWGQADAVFIAGCELPDRWQQSACLRLLETGFGLGVNFLSAWASLKASRGQARLDYVSIEKHPFTREDLSQALSLSLDSVPAQQSAPLRRLAERLVSQWPPLLAGFHTLELDEHVTLTLVFADIDDALARLAGRFDAFFLDGFAPDRNPAMWSPQVMNSLATLAAPGARLSSWCVAGAVRRALAAAGFNVSKRPGYGGKRDCLSAQWPAEGAAGQPVPAASTVATAAVPATSAIVIGAGIAGASVARQLARRGLDVLVLERDRPAEGGSGNPVAVVRPEPGGASNPITELTAAGVTWLKRWIETNASDIPHDWCGVLRIARDERKRDKMAQQASGMENDWLEAVDLPQAARLCGMTPAESGFHLPQAAWLKPADLVAAILAHPRIDIRSQAKVVALDRAGDIWQVQLADGCEITAPLVVLTTAFDQGLGATRLSLGRARGQLSRLASEAGRPLQKIVCRDGYITPAVDGFHTLGATVQHDDEETQARRSDDEQNFERLQRLLPGFAPDASVLESGRVGWRSTTPDRLPLVGALDSGLYVSLGHGARGITCAPLCGEFLAAMICDEPLPLGKEWVSRLDPMRRTIKP